MKNTIPLTHTDYRVYDSEPQAEHIVEDARTKPRLDAPTEIKKEKKFSKGKTILLTAMITLLAFSLTLVAADIIGSGGIALYTSLFTQKKSDVSLYYAVYATHSTDMSVSYKNAAVVREEGGAGYVMKQGEEYYVILNVYDDEESAKRVSERKANYGIIELKVYDFDVEKQPSLSSAEMAKDLYREAYKTLYQAANDLASGKYAKEDMKREISSCKQKVTAVEDAYVEKTAGITDTPAIEFKVILAEIRSAFENLEQNDERLVADARYFSVMIVRSYADFTKKYFA